MDYQKSNIFQTRWKTRAFTCINYIREFIAQKLKWQRDPLLMRESFAEGLLRKSVPQLEQSLCSASTEHAVVQYIRSV